MATVCIVLLAAVFAATSTSARQSGEKPLQNEDVLLLVRAGLTDDVVIAKIKQAALVKFVLDPESLVALRKNGVSDRVMEAMLDRSGRGAPAPAISPSRPGVSSVPPAGSIRSPGAADADPATVAIAADGGAIVLTPSAGTTTSVWAYFKMMRYTNVVGLRADVRLITRRPEFLVRARQVQNRYYIVRLDQDQDDGVRSVKIKTGVFGASSDHQPDSDWQFPYQVIADGPESWRFVLKADLKPGEYGILDRLRGVLWDFAIENANSAKVPLH